MAAIGAAARVGGARLGKGAGRCVSASPDVWSLQTVTTSSHPNVIIMEPEVFLLTLTISNTYRMGSSKNPLKVCQVAILLTPRHFFSLSTLTTNRADYSLTCGLKEKNFFSCYSPVRPKMAFTSCLKECHPRSGLSLICYHPKKPTMCGPKSIVCSLVNWLL